MPGRHPKDGRPGMHGLRGGRFRRHEPGRALASHVHQFTQLVAVRGHIDRARCGGTVDRPPVTLLIRMTLG